MSLRTPGLVVVGLLLSASTYADQSQTSESNRPTIDGVAAAELSPLITRHAAGPPTLHAVRISEPLRIDGRLDEPLYSVAPISDFVQMEPDEGMPATERTDVWIAFDHDTLYVTFRCWNRSPSGLLPRRCVATIQRSGAATTRSVSFSTRSKTAGTAWNSL
jgi:hypothetical protein